MTKKYRQNVGAVIIKNNLLWAGRRIDVVSENENIGWQLPQGGIDKNENANDAVYREIFEETGIKSDKIMLCKKMQKSLKYDFPDFVLNKKKHIVGSYCGQEQYWYVFNFIGKDSDINLKATDKQEFIKWEWKTAEFIIKNIVDFKKNTYLKLFNWIKKEKLINFNLDL